MGLLILEKIDWIQLDITEYERWAVYYSCIVMPIYKYKAVTSIDQT